MKQETIKKLVWDYFEGQISENLNRMMNVANHDLYFGPIEQGEEIDNEWTYPGFQSAMDYIQENLPDISDLYIDTQCDYVTDKEPEGEEIDGEWEEPIWEDWFHLERKEVLSIIVGKELHKYL